MPTITEWLIMIAVVTFACILAFRPATHECVKPVVEVRKSQPEICAPFFTDGTGRWAECMGVGTK